MPGRGRYSSIARFPPNRIKKIMQEDEEVGKMTHPVPVMVARCLELFTARLVSRAGQVAEERGARTLSTLHLRAAVEGDITLDFLRPLVAKVAAPSSSPSTSPTPTTTQTAQASRKRPAGTDFSIDSLLAHQGRVKEVKEVVAHKKKKEKGKAVKEVVEDKVEEVAKHPNRPMAVDEDYDDF